MNSKPNEIVVGVLIVITLFTSAFELGFWDIFIGATGAFGLFIHGLIHTNLNWKNGVGFLLSAGLLILSFYSAWPSGLLIFGVPAAIYLKSLEKEA